MFEIKGIIPVVVTPLEENREKLKKILMDIEAL